MSWKGAGIGAAVGAVFGGPLGAGVGAAIGHFFSKDSENSNNDEKMVHCPHCGTELIIKNEGVIWKCNNCQKSFIAVENFHSEDDYTTYLYLSIFGLIAKMAKIDGVVSKEEAKTIGNILNSFCNNQDEREIAKNFYKEARDDNYNLDYYAELFYSISKNSDGEELRKAVYSALFEVASADGGLEEVEKNALLKLLEIFKLNKNFYEYLYNQLVGNQMSLSEYYKILDCNENCSNEEIKKAYKEKAKQFHPDVISAKNLPEAFVKFANEQMKLITEAYEIIKKNRNF